MRSLALLLVLAGPILSSVAVAEPEQKIVCEFTCSQTFPPFMCDDPPCVFPFPFAIQVFPEDVSGPLEVTPTFETKYAQHLKQWCEAKGHQAHFEKAQPFCFLVPTDRAVHTFKDAETGIELVVPGRDNAVLRKVCGNLCPHPEIVDVCRQLGDELGKPLGLPTLRMVNMPGLMNRFKSSDAARALIAQRFWLADKGLPTEPHTESGDQYFYDLTEMRAKQPHENPNVGWNYTHGSVCAVDAI